MNEPRPLKLLLRGDLVFLGAFVVVKLALHLTFNRWYGYHHDELYFLACGHHPAFGYVDHPPLVPWIAALSDLLFGQSLPGLRFFSAVAGAAAVFLTGLLTRRLGGGRFAQAVACIAMITAPVYLRSGNILAIPSFEPFYWVLCSYFVVRVIQEDNPRLWLWVGLVAGIGLMNKHTMAFFGIGLVVGLLLTPQRKQFRSPWLYAGGLLAFLIFVPNLIWQMENGWPTLHFIRNLNRGVMSGISVFQFLLGQFLYEHPVNAPIWILGLVFFFRTEGKPYRVFGWLYLAVFVLLVIAKSKIYYLAPAYPPLFAGGALALERFARKTHHAWLKPVTVGVLCAGGSVFVPLALPILNIETTDRYINAITFGALGNIYEVTGDLHGQFWWPERVAAVAKVYDSLSPEEQANTVIFAGGYGDAGAIDYFGGAYGLPNAVSNSMTYYLWGPGDKNPEIVIAVGVGRDFLEQVFEEIEDTPIVKLEHVNPGDREFHIRICRKPKISIQKLWPQLRPW